MPEQKKHQKYSSSMSSVKKFLSKEEQDLVVDAIKKAELKTSGEIRIRIEKTTDISVMDRAKTVFFEMGMDKTSTQNGVLIYLAIDDKAFSIIGDTAIDKIVQATFWQNLSNQLHHYFVQKKYVDGIIKTINDIGDILHQHFPLDKNSNNINELPNEISYDE